MKKQVSDEIKKRLSKESYYNEEQFVSDCHRYIKAVKSGRIICSIGSVSSSGMSRTIKFVEMCKGSDKMHRIYNFYAFFRIMGYQQVNTPGLQDYFRIGGCGMDMIFHTNYTVIHRLQRMGFLNKKQCEKLAQMTPPII